MTRSDYTSQLRQIHDDLLMLGSMVEKSLIKAIDALRHRDLEASKSVSYTHLTLPTILLV